MKLNVVCCNRLIKIYFSLDECGIFLVVEEISKVTEEIIEIVYPEWCANDIALLFKSVSKFPGGVVDRWQVIASYVSAHTDTKREWQDCIATYGKGSGIQSSSGTIQTGAVVSGWESKGMKEVGDLGSYRDWGDVPDRKEIKIEAIVEEVKFLEELVEKIKVVDDGIWTDVQLKHLSTALKTYPPLLYTLDPTKRWHDVANAVEGKTKKQVKEQVKYAASLRKK